MLWALKTLLCSDLPGRWFTIKEIVIQTNNLFSCSASINTLWTLNPMWVAYKADRVLILPAKVLLRANNFKQWLLTEGLSFGEILINCRNALFSSWLTIKLFTNTFYNLHSKSYILSSIAIMADGAEICGENRKLVSVFSPHLYSKLKSCLR